MLRTTAFLLHVMVSSALLAPVQAGPAGTAAEVSARAAQLRPGEELVIRDGVYTDLRAEIPCKGTEAQPIVVRTESPGGVLFRRGTVVRITGDWVVLRGFRFEQCGPGPVVNVVGGSHNRITECRFLHCGNPRSTFTHIVEIGELSHENRVDHCDFEGSKSMSLALRTTTRAKLGRRNRFHHNTFRDIVRFSDNGQEAVQLGQGGSTEEFDAYTLVEYNLFDNASGDPEFISNKSSRNVLRYNVAANCRAALVLRGGSDCLVEGNVLVRNSDGIRIHGSRHTVVNNVLLDIANRAIIVGNGGPGYARVEGCLIAHNTVVNLHTAGLSTASIHADATVPPRGNRVLNNLFTSASGTLLSLAAAPANEIAANLLWATGKAQAGTEGRDPVRGDPLLAGAELALRLAPGSPALDRAVPLPEVVRDWLGRPRGKAPDIGAEELGAGESAIEALPPVPPARKPFDVEALKGHALFAMDTGDPLRGLEATPGEGAAVERGTVRLTDAAVWLARELPADFVAEWEYSPAALGSRAQVVFGAAGRTGGYTLGFGGEASGKAEGVVSLAKGEAGAIVADGPDTVFPNRKPRQPGPNVWYRCRLVKCGPLLRLEIAGTPVLVWEDTGVVGGPCPGAGALGICQSGAGAWRGLRVWACKP